MSTIFHHRNRHDIERGSVAEHETPPRPDIAPEIGGSALNAVSNDHELLGLWGRTSRKTKMVTGLVLATTVAAGVGFGVAASNSHEHAAPRQPGASAPAVPGAAESITPSAEATTTPEVASADKSPDSVVDPTAPEVTTTLSSEKINTYYNMSVEDFYASVPVEDRIAYGKLVVDTYTPYTVEQLKKKTATHYDYVAPKTTSMDATGQDLIQLYGQKLAALKWSLTQNGDPYHILDERRNEAKKGFAALLPENDYNGETKGFHDQVYNTFDTTTSLVADGAGWGLMIAHAESGLVSDFTGQPAKYIEAGGSLNGWTLEMSYNKNVKDWVVKAASTSHPDFASLKPYQP